MATTEHDSSEVLRKSQIFYIALVLLTGTHITSDMVALDGVRSFFHDRTTPVSDLLSAFFSEGGCPHDILPFTMLGPFIPNRDITRIVLRYAADNAMINVDSDDVDEWDFIHLHDRPVSGIYPTATSEVGAHDLVTNATSPTDAYDE